MKTWADRGTGSRLPTGDDLTAPEVSAEQIAAARLVVCERAADVDDARFLLAVLGLGAA